MPLDREELREQERREAWDRYLAAQLSKPFPKIKEENDADLYLYLKGCAVFADYMLAERDKRFGKS